MTDTTYIAPAPDTPAVAVEQHRTTSKGESHVPAASSGSLSSGCSSPAPASTDTAAAAAAAQGPGERAAHTPSSAAPEPAPAPGTEGEGDNEKGRPTTTRSDRLCRRNRKPAPPPLKPAPAPALDTSPPFPERLMRPPHPEAEAVSGPGPGPGPRPRLLQTLPCRTSPVPRGWRGPCMDLIDPAVLLHQHRHQTAWHFWDCLAPLGCRDQDMVIFSRDGMAFPCAAWNPCIHSKVLSHAIKNPPPEVRQIWQYDLKETLHVFGCVPIPCLILDEDARATHLLLSFIHPIPLVFLPDTETAEQVLALGTRYQVDKAIGAAWQRLQELGGGTA